jgi:hypothetical protein
MNHLLNRAFFLVLFLALAFFVIGQAGDEGCGCEESLAANFCTPDDPAFDYAAECEDGNECTASDCINNACSRTPYREGQPCNLGGICRAGECVVTDGGTGGTGGSPTTPAMAFTGPCPADGQLPAIADAFIRGDGFSNTPYGEEQRLAIKSVINQSFTRKIYIAFDVSPRRPFDPDNPGFVKAYLVLSLRRHIGDVNPATEPGPQPVDVLGITDDNDWDPATLPENEITWDNAPRNVTAAMPSLPQFEQGPGVPLLIPAYDFDVPPRGEVDLGTESDPPGVTRYALDITEYVEERLENDADGTITVLMAASNPMNINQEGSDFWSLQAPDECNRPLLHFE